MTQEEKALLLQDLCARLPYGVKVTFAGKTLGISSSSISACCLGKRKSIGGYTWKYLHDVK